MNRVNLQKWKWNSKRRFIAGFLLGSAILLAGCDQQKYKAPLSTVDPTGNLKKSDDGTILGPDGKKAKSPPKAMPGSKIGGPIMPGGPTSGKA